MAEFADPYPVRIVCELIGVPAHWHDRFRGWANDLGLAFTYTAAANLKRIESALAGPNAATAQLITAHRDGCSTLRRNSGDQPRSGGSGR